MWKDYNYDILKENDKLELEVNKMKKIVAGGFLSLVGSIWALAILVSASCQTKYKKKYA